jgi:hypothetical protein
MCGIIGILTKDVLANFSLDRFLYMLNHRGPSANVLSK